MDAPNPLAEHLQTTNMTQRQLVERLREHGVKVTQGAISQWLTNGVPPKRVAPVSKVTGIPTHKLRPDVFPPPEPTAPA